MAGLSAAPPRFPQAPSLPPHAVAIPQPPHSAAELTLQRTHQERGGAGRQKGRCFATCFRPPQPPGAYKVCVCLRGVGPRPSFPARQPHEFDLIPRPPSRVTARGAPAAARLLLPCSCPAPTAPRGSRSVLRKLIDPPPVPQGRPGCYAQPDRVGVGLRKRRTDRRVALMRGDPRTP